MKKVFSVFPQNLAYYNEGMLVGGWINLPQPPEIIDKFLKEVVKIDNEHEEYEIVDADDYPFEYEGIQWGDLHKINDLAIIYSTLDECQKEAVYGYCYTAGKSYWSINELINVCLQADNINYYQYHFKGIEYSKDCSINVKMGYTMAEENGLYQELEKLNVLDFFDFEKYGDSFSYDYELFENGYLIFNSELDLEFYSNDDIKEKVLDISINIQLEKEEMQIEI